MGIGGMIQGIANGFLAVGKGYSESTAAEQQSWLDQATAGYNARQAQLKGNAETARLRMLGAQTVAKQKVAYANSGVDPTTGTAAAVQSDTAAMNELDVQTAKNNAAREAWGFKLQREQSKKNLETKLGNIKREMTGSMVTGIAQFADGGMGMGGGG